MAYRIGIDFGTCFSYIAYGAESGGAEAVHTLINPVDRLPYEIPSIFFHGENEKDYFLCGIDAIDHFDSVRDSKDEYRYAVKHIKQSLLKEGSLTTFKLKGGEITSKEIVVHFFKHIKELTEESLRAEDHNEGYDLTLEAVIAVPVIFTPQERSILIDSATEAGITVVGLIEEPVAIAIDYIEHLKNKNDLEPILVYDLGGGTIDATCVKYHPGNTQHVKLYDGNIAEIPSEKTYEVISTSGKRIGGLKWDDELSALISSGYLNEYKSLPPYDPTRSFSKRVTEAKHMLTKRELVSMPFTHLSGQVPENREIKIDRTAFDKKTKSLLNETLDCIREISNKCGLKNGSKVRVILSGGSSRMPQVRTGVIKILEEEIGVTISNKKSMLFRHEKAVASGATRYSNALKFYDPNTAPNMYGISVYDESGNLKDEKFLIDKGQPLPFTKMAWELDAPSGSIQVVVTEKYDRVSSYLTQTDKIIKMDLSLKSPGKIIGNLKMFKGGVIKFEVLNPENGETNTTFYSINTFPHPRRVKIFTKSS